MIILEDVSKSYMTKTGWNQVFTNVNLSIAPGQRMGILGKNGSGKSTLVRLMSGATFPSEGRIIRKMSVSWPLGLSSALQSNLTGFDNVRFISRIYGVDFAHSEAFIRDFSELGNYLDEPVRNYSSGMRSRLAFAISFLVDFECYLIDEALEVGDKAFREKCRYELLERHKDAAIILVSHNEKRIKEFCDSAVLLREQTIHHFDTLKQALQSYS